MIVDYLGKRFIIEMKIWNGEKYHQEGEDQLEGYLERYHLEKGYLLTFSFNKRKEPRIEEKLHKGKTLLEVFV